MNAQLLTRTALEGMIAEVEPANPEEWDEAWQEIQVG